MTERDQPAREFSLGDKVRVRAGPYAGSRGVVRAIGETGAVVTLLAGTEIALSFAEITNYSAAARRAWQSMPKRAGRPRLPAPRKKLVSVRLDLDVWRMLAQAAECGLVPSREQAINAWLRERLVHLLPTAAAPSESLQLQSRASGEHDG